MASAFGGKSFDVVILKPQAGLTPRDDRKNNVLRTDARLTGAGGRSRTNDLPITNRLLYQLSYAGVSGPQSKPTGIILGSRLFFKRFVQFDVDEAAALYRLTHTRRVLN